MTTRQMHRLCGEPGRGARPILPPLPETPRRREPQDHEEVPHIMKSIAVGFVSLIITLLPCEPAWAWSHANRYGGSTSHGEGTVHTNAYGGGTAHGYGEGTVHANSYGGSTSHDYGGGTTHTNAYGG